jgi:hypothetical protein
MPKKNFKTREQQEAGENLETIKTDVPDSRFQSEQQDNPADTAESVKAPKGNFSKSVEAPKGGVLKQEVASHVVTKGIGGAIPESSTSLRSLSYSGNEGTILDSAAYTPIAGQSRSDSRFGKKIDTIAKKMNYVPSEQVEVSFDESKPLAANPSATQGYNGTPRNTNARMQKATGAVPSELLFQRSLDEIKRDQLYFSTGQVIDSGVHTFDTPTKTEALDDQGIPVVANYSINRGNYLHRNMRIKFKDGKLVSMKFDVADLSCSSTDPKVLNASSAAATIDRNQAEMDRQIMDDKAGDEKAEVWTPLARAVREPTKTVGYLRDLENITGSEIFMAYKKTAMAFSYQLNRTAKDGMKLHTPMNEALLGLIHGEDSSLSFGSLNPFSKAEYLNGSSSLFIAIYDSVSKYTTKADILMQPRGFKLAMQTADNNMNPLRVKAHLVQNVNAHEAFSTIDREYDPLMPVCISDRAALIHCYDFNDLYSFEYNDSTGRYTFKKDPFRYGYADLRNVYSVSAALPLLKGLHAYFDSIATKVCSVQNGDLNNKEIVVPMVHSTCFFSLWSLFLLMATPFITQERVNSMRDVLYYEGNVEYPFHQLISIKDANPMNAVNYGNTDYQQPIEVRRMSPALALTWTLPEMFWPFDELTADDSYHYVLPWYFNEQDFDITGVAISKKDTRYAMSYPSVRAGSRFGYLDDIYGMEERDVRLILDKLTDLPTLTTGTDNQGVYKWSQNADGIPYVTMSGTNFNVRAFLSLPREQGDFIVAPAGVLSQVISSKKTYGYKGMTLTDGTGSDAAMFGETSYLAKYWHGRLREGAQAPGNAGILKAPSILVDRATAYRQDWDAIPATLIKPDSADWGFTLSMGDMFDGWSLKSGQSIFIPFTNGVNGSNGEQTQKTDGTVYAVVSLQKALWTRVQLLPFAISPWDVVSSVRKVGEDAVKVDPFDFLYYFGLAGFKASDYTEDVYNRSTQVLDQGFLFLDDPFIKANPLYKEAIDYTQSTNVDSLRK